MRRHNVIKETDEKTVLHVNINKTKKMVVHKINRARAIITDCNATLYMERRLAAGEASATAEYLEIGKFQDQNKPGNILLLISMVHYHSK